MKDTGKNTKTNFFAKAGQAIGKFFQWLRGDLKEIGTTFVEGDWKTKVSFLIMGFGNFARKQFVRGIAFLATEILFILYMVKVGFKYLPDLGTLGTVESGYDENFLYVYGDNSFFILLFSILSIFAILGFILVWRINVKNNRQTELLLKQGKKIPTNRQDLASLFDKHFDKTLLALPMLGIGVFVVLPIVFMICIAFTNYDYSHLSPVKLFMNFESFSGARAKERFASPRIHLFSILFYRGVSIAVKSKDLFSKYLAFGVLFQILFQAIMNLCVVVGIIPVTGYTLQSNFLRRLNFSFIFKGKTRF